MRYKTRRDLWLSIVIWFCIILLLICGSTPLYINGAGHVGGPIIMLVCLMVAAFIAWLWLGTDYVLSEQHLIVRSGPISTRIPYDQITKVKPIRSWLSSMATSSQRLEIHYGKYQFIHISPQEEKLFVTELQQKCPQVQIDLRS